MCGIVGIAGERLPEPGLLDGMCRMIAHRGPDDQGTYCGTMAQIGMRRLSIIDLSSGHQPIHNEDKTVWIVFNGEIYNYQQLRKELEQRGHRFYTSTDTECIVHCYEEFGQQCFSRLRGMFAIAILDIPNNTLVLARDRLGKKPLYYTCAAGRLAFASELKSLLLIPGLNRRTSLSALQDYLVLGYIPAPATIYEDVHKLPPAHTLVFHQGKISLHRYWQLPFEPKWEADEHGLKEELLARLEDAVRVRLVSDVPFGAFLSGGLDSSVVAALMARNLDRPLKTFTIGFKEDAFNEIPDARNIARHIGSDHHELVVEADAVSLLETLTWHFDEPFADASAIPTYLVAKLAAEHVKMVLSGDGGDESFAGYDRYDRYQRLSMLSRLPAGIVGHALQWAGTMLPGARGNRLGRIGRRIRQRYPERYLSGVALCTEADLRLMLGGRMVSADLFEHVRAHYLRQDISSELDRILAGDMTTYLVDDVLVKVDRMTMANSLEARAPLLDHELMEFAARLPMAMKKHGRRGKYLLRQAARHLLPESCLVKRKQGFGIPLARWFRGELREMAADLLHSKSLRERGVFDVAGVQQCFSRHLQGLHDYSEQLWLVLNHELWARRFLDTDTMILPGEIPPKELRHVPR